MIFRLLAEIAYIIVVILETLLGLRFIFKLFGSSATNIIVKAVYQWTNITIAPFKGIIPDGFYLGSFYIELVTLLTIFVLMLIAYGLIEIKRAFSR